jgi:hypothetical protein
VALDHLSYIELGESGGAIYDLLPYVYLFRVKAFPNYLEDIELFSTIGLALAEYPATKKRFSC